MLGQPRQHRLFSGLAERVDPGKMHVNTAGPHVNLQLPPGVGKHRPVVIDTHQHPNRVAATSRKDKHRCSGLAHVHPLADPPGADPSLADQIPTRHSHLCGVRSAHVRLRHPRAKTHRRSSRHVDGTSPILMVEAWLCLGSVTLAVLSVPAFLIAQNDNLGAAILGQALLVLGVSMSAISRLPAATMPDCS
jgi:hypothetical protein